MIPATQRPIKHRPLRRALDRYGDGQHHRKAGKQKNDRQRKIEAPLEHLAVKRMRKRAVPAGQLRLRGVPRPGPFPMPRALPFLRAALKRRHKLSYHTRGEEVNFLWKFRKILQKEPEAAAVVAF